MNSIFAYFGDKVNSFLSEVGQMVKLMFSIISYFPRAFRDKHLVIAQMKLIGADSLPLVVLIGAFTGAIAALEATDLFIKFNLINLAKPYIGSSIASAVFTELTPVLTALVIAGRVGASMAAEIGTMKVTEQIDALEMMAIDKSRYLGMPRMIAALLMMPMLAVFSDLVAIAGGFILTVVQFDFSFTSFSSLCTIFPRHELMTA